MIKSFGDPKLMGTVSAIVLSCVLGSVPSAGQGPGDLMVSPKRVVFEGRERSALLTLVNRGSATATYRISFVNIRMREDGGFEEIEEPVEGQRFAQDFFHYSPRQVTLEPGASQQVRLLLRRPADLETGEYRSHLRFLAVPLPEKAGTTLDELVGESTKISFKLTPVFGVTIPVIVRQGSLSAEVELTELAVTELGDGRSPEVSFRLERRGDRSVFGDLTFTFEPLDGAEPTVVGVVHGIAVYTPNRSRTVHLPLHTADGAGLGEGVLRATYAARPDEGAAVLAEGRTRIP